MPGTLGTKDPQETDVQMRTNVMDKGPARPTDGAKEHQGQQRMRTIDTMKL